MPEELQSGLLEISFCTSFLHMTCVFPIIQLAFDLPATALLGKEKKKSSFIPLSYFIAETTLH